jgi:hypothetical protein
MPALIFSLIENLGKKGKKEANSRRFLERIQSAGHRLVPNNSTMGNHNKKRMLN